MRVPEDKRCEVCQVQYAWRLIDLNTDEQHGAVFWWACMKCADELSPQD